ncbi:phosphoglycerate mutase [candidate division TA06 bacterium]|uniref:Phosphoglycerate mutase n=1 Tax=candidate division TA06 bacterium TaxID=2250710 RepID=A0A660SCX6_UNCT6|nr:MAG: phosphoglycerate mutase [candidate division TA06 bacterium]
MIKESLMKKLSIDNDNKILLVVMDGVGDIRWTEEGDRPTPLEEADKPNIDSIAMYAILGEGIPVDYGITPGSGPAHISLFGYDPLKYDIGRGILEAAGIGLKVNKTDIAIRGNFATIDDKRIVTDRRAGRISTEKNRELVKILNNKIEKIEDISVEFYAGKEHRCVVLLKGEGLKDNVTDTDPQAIGKRILDPIPKDASSKKTADICKKLSDKIIEVLKEYHPANAILLRGISNPPDLPSMNELFKLKPICIATYPMYKGLSHLVGMEVIQNLTNFEEQVEALKANYNDYNFFYFHVKKTDSYGEDGNYKAKISVIEEFDKYFKDLVDLGFDVIVVTGDHSTPCSMKGHSFHPTPIMLYSKKYLRYRDRMNFMEVNCNHGSLGRIYSKDLMQLMLAYSGKLKKYGA